MTGTGEGTSAQQICQQIYAELRKVFFGQDQVVSQVLAALLSGGHILLEGKPGLGKTHLVLALANTFGGEFGRIQFTPDLMPTDVTGFTLFDMKSQTFQMRRGPVFTNLLLGDEINRAPAKTQAALLEVMQERQVTIDGESIKLDPPFMVLATQNPIEQEGTYPLPEAQLDRFLMKVVIDYPDQASEEQVVSQVTSGASASGIDASEVERICSQEEIIQAQRECASIQAVPEVVRYAVNICRATRESQGISLGAGTRGAISLIQVAKAYALINGRGFVTPDDVKSASLPVLRHRVQLAPELAISGQKVDDAVAGIVNAVEAPRV
ncbi:MoxR family ATPase [Verrucomicrobiaceae bacterium N1E253]|uniref:MoxR family ATPase n=2 Tax=Oceaniferula marina TaxID=2748318 RepID=A0A851G9V2_9BACT|nr:MoxR family ATPase [Oceaniferula marina]